MHCKNEYLAQYFGTFTSKHLLEVQNEDIKSKTEEKKNQPFGKNVFLF